MSIKDTIKGFKLILDGEHDSLPEDAFFMVGGIDEAAEQGKRILEEREE